MAHNTALLDFHTLLDAVKGQAVLGKLLQKMNSDEIASSFCFSGVVCDSRKIHENALFVPLKGEKVDAHDFIPDVLKKGASCVFIQSDIYVKNKNTYDELCEVFPKTVFIVVENTLYALQDAARAYVKKFTGITKIAVTGSSGKTTTKEILTAIFDASLGSEKVISNEGNLNSDIGLPLSVFRIRKEHRVGIFEMGMNRAGEIAELASVLVPDYALITNIGTAHIGILGSKDAIAKEKKSVFAYFTAHCKGFIPENDEYADFLQTATLGEIKKFGSGSIEQGGEQCGISNIKDCGINGFDFLISGFNAHFPLCGSHNFQNMLGAVLLAKDFGIDAQKIAAGLAGVKTGFARSQIVKRDITIIQDCYNANPDSMAASLKFFANISARKIIVLGDMKELGSVSLNAHIEIAKKALESGALLVVFFGENFCKALDSFDPFDSRDALKNAQNTYAPETLLFNTYTDGDIEEAAKKINAVLQDGDTVLLKASRSVALERIAPLLMALNGKKSVAAHEVRYA